MVESLYPDRKLRHDLKIIADLVQPGHRVLDLGCGDGSFLKMLRETRGADILGMEIEHKLIAQCIANGVPVIQGDLNDGLDFAEENSFDLVILSQTLQQVKRPDRLLRRIVRVGRRAAVSFINFGHFHCRLQLLFAGSMPRTTQIPYQWYNTPNIHLGTIRDFQKLCNHLNIRIYQEIPVGMTFPLLTTSLPNLFAVGCVFVLERK